MNLMFNFYFLLNLKSSMFCYKYLYLQYILIIRLINSDQLKI